MASFAAELHVAGHVFPLRHCTYHATQATDTRGRPTEKVRKHAVQLVLHPPDNHFFEGWAHHPTKRLEAHVLFRDPDQCGVRETLRLPAAYCVAYDEKFEAGNAADGSYLAFVTLVDPDGWPRPLGTTGRR
ncbi:type VI secretion system tube protein TssD [Hymenobacter sp.]|uniref:type VI secretion system tube protein TssD n=1 Tax=Hymenobacter sp. TaxID=1898978 RepID=UPI00286B6B71|nr:type VI secretion system tube protein TssD [Hymenobacter sp.]